MLGLFFIGVPVSILALWFILKNLDNTNVNDNDKGPPDDNC